jgi:bacterioferritin
MRGEILMGDVELIQGMNRDLSQELGTICRSIQQAAMVRSPAGRDFRIFLKVRVIDDVMHALFLAEKIADLGGVPNVTPTPFQTLTDPKEMLQHELETERYIIRHYTERLKQAEAVWALGLKTRLEKILADEIEHEKAIRGLLGKADTEGALGGSPLKATAG